MKSVRNSKAKRPLAELKDFIRNAVGLPISLGRECKGGGMGQTGNALQKQMRGDSDSTS